MKYILIIFCLILIPLSSGALEIGAFDPDRIVKIVSPEPPRNLSNETVNHSNSTDWWITTDLGPIDSVSDIGSGDITDEGNWRTIDNGTFTFPIHVTGNITGTDKLSIGGTADIQDNITAGNGGISNNVFYTADRGGGGEAFIGMTNWLFLGVLNFVELYASDNGGAQRALTIRDSLFVRGLNQDPSITFINALGTVASVIKFDRTSDSIAFTGATSYTFDKDVIVDSATDGLVLSPTQLYKIASSSINAFFNVDGNDVNHIFISSVGSAFVKFDSGSNSVMINGPALSSNYKFEVNGDSRFGSLLAMNTTIIDENGTITQQGLAIAQLNDLNVTGNLNQTLGNATINMIYGEMWAHSDSGTWIGDIVTQNVWINISINSTGTEDNGGFNNGFEYDESNSALISQFNGIAKCDYSISTGNQGNNQEYQFALSKNDAILNQTDAHRKIGSSGDVGSSGSGGLVSLVSGDIINLQGRNNDGIGDLDLHSINVNCVRIAN